MEIERVLIRPTQNKMSTRHKWTHNLSPKMETTLLALTLSIGYCTTYLFTRPLFVLPDAYLNVSTTKTSSIDRQTALALAQSLGYLSSKFIAIPFMSSAMFFARKQFYLSCLYILTASIVGVGFAVFDSSPILQALSVGLSSICAGMIYGGMVSYAEGRGSTEIIVASLNLTLVLAGGIARFLGTALVHGGVPSHLVPGVASLLGLVIGLVLLDILAALPPPSKQDQKERGVRRSMSSAERKAFLTRFGPGIFLSLVAYASVMTIRSFRDYFALQLYTEANGGIPPAASIYFWADFPGSVTVCLSLGILSYVKSNRTTVVVMITSMIIGVVVLGGGTVAYNHGLMGGIAWQVSCGVGIYTAYLVMGTAFFDRLLAASKNEGTIIFLQFISDGTGWCGTVILLFWKSLWVDKNMPVAELFANICWWSSIVLFFSLLAMMLYFIGTLPKENNNVDYEVKNNLDEEDGLDGLQEDDSDEPLLPQSMTVK